jgi:hypothetical protein
MLTVEPPLPPRRSMEGTQALDGVQGMNIFHLYVPLPEVATL